MTGAFAMLERTATPGHAGAQDSDHHASVNGITGSQPLASAAGGCARVGACQTDRDASHDQSRVYSSQQN